MKSHFMPKMEKHVDLLGEKKNIPVFIAVYDQRLYKIVCR